MAEETIKQTLLVTLAVCFVCSLAVSGLAIALKSRQEFNQEQDARRNVLQVAGLYNPGGDTSEAFKNVQTRVLDLENGEWAEKKLLADSPVLQLSRQQDIARIQSVPRYRKVYLVYHKGVLERVILPVQGYGLWSTMYGFLALDGGGKTVYGLKFYEQKETPGLGGEVENPTWRKQWRGKHLYDSSGNLCIEVVKGKVPAGAKNAACKIDGISGATLTSRGVSNLVRFWSGKLGYGKFLKRLREGKVKLEYDADKKNS